jgi:hypothetical protein
MWFVLQAAIIFGVFCWIGQHVDYIADGKGCQSGTNDSPRFTSTTGVVRGRGD